MIFNKEYICLTFFIVFDSFLFVNDYKYLVGIESFAISVKENCFKFSQCLTILCP